jgi:hypothetical protein
MWHFLVFFMVTHSACSALPLAIFVTSDEKEQTPIDALELLKSCLPDFAFYGAHASKVFMTDNCYELRASLNEVWPSAVSVLCIFHLLQQVWRCLHEKRMESTWRIDLNCFCHLKELSMLKVKKTCMTILMILCKVT